jgi:hypothetical protein
MNKFKNFRFCFLILHTPFKALEERWFGFSLSKSEISKELLVLDSFALEEQDEDMMVGLKFQGRNAKDIVLEKKKKIGRGISRRNLRELNFSSFHFYYFWPA